MSNLTKAKLLAARSKRKDSQEQILSQFGDNLVSMTMNIPGLEKSNEKIVKAFTKAFFGLIEVMKFEGYHINHVEFNDVTSGPVGFISCKGDCYELKCLLVLYEESTTIGRLLDVDIIHMKYGQITRSDLAFEPRKCFLCDEEANFCRRNQTHTLDELMEYVNERLKVYNT